MDRLNKLFDREKLEKEIISILVKFEQSPKRGIYIYGSPGSGKTQFVTRILKGMDYDVITYDAGDVRNKSLFQNIDSNHVSNRNVLDLMYRRVKKIAIIMDEIDGMNNGDKGGIDALIKLIRQKKTKKQKGENTTMNPIICIGNMENDKKIRELMKACYTFEMKTPTNNQITELLNDELPPFMPLSSPFKDDILHYIQGDLRKVNFMCKLWRKNPLLLTPETIHEIFHVKVLNKDAKSITCNLLQQALPLKEHNQCINETDRTTIALLWHENIITSLSHLPIKDTLPFYETILKNMCFADYIGRITFQSQIWQFNEMGSLMKTFFNNKLYHERFPNRKFSLENIEFTKVLTKYSTEYNNQIFLQGLCQKMNMDKKDVTAFFQELRLNLGFHFYNQREQIVFVEHHLGKNVIDALDIKRMYRFLDKNVKKEDLEEDGMSE